MPDRRRIGHVSVICVIVLACVGGNRGAAGATKGPKMGQLTLSMGPARAKVCSYVQGVIIPSK